MRTQKQMENEMKMKIERRARVNAITTQREWESYRKLLIIII